MSIDWTPDTADVAAELRARVKDSGGIELADFSADTRPSNEQVMLLIVKAVGDVVGRTGTLESCTADNIDDLRQAASDMATLRAAMRIERSFFPEQLRGDQSPYNALKAEYDEGMKSLVEAVGESCGGGGGDAVGGVGNLPASYFDDRALVGPGTCW